MACALTGREERPVWPLPRQSFADGERPMRRFARSRRRRGVITVEWIAFVTVLVIGTIGGLAVARNAIVSELKDIADAITALDLFP